MNLDHVYVLISVMLLSFLSVNIFKVSIRDKTEDLRNHYVDAVSKFFGKAAIGILLPILFFESFVSNADKINDILIGVLYGALFAFSTLMLGWFMTKIISSSYIYGITHVVGSTFGGGNRGVVLMIVTMSLLSIDDSYFSYFYAVDFGNFMFFLFAIPTYLRRVYSVKGDAPTFTISSTLKDLGIANIVIILVVLLLYLDIGSEVAGKAVSFIEPTKEERSFLLLYLSFCLIFLKIDIHAAHIKIAANIAFITLCRFIVLFVMGVILLEGSREFTLETVVNNGYLLALVVLCLCPPSSLVGGQIDIHTGDNEAVIFANTLNIYMVFLYFCAICIVLSLSFLSAKYKIEFI